MQTIVKMIFGSHLYGTATPNSDTDFKGIFLPSKKDIILGKVKKSINTQTKADGHAKNSAGDVDTEFYSLQYFVELALEGQMVAIDMLHAPESYWIESSTTWEFLVMNRERFYTKNLSAFVGYARRQAAKYGIKGSRIHAIAAVIDVLKQARPDQKLSDIWEYLPRCEHCYDYGVSPNGVRQYQVCGKIMQETQKVQYTWDILWRDYANYGQRARDAAENKNIDWKAVSHAIRAALQVKEILTKKTITFPLADTELLRDIKTGKLDYTTVVAPMLEKLMDEVEALSKVSTLPEQANREYWEEFIMETVQMHVFHMLNRDNLTSHCHGRKWKTG